MADESRLQDLAYPGTDIDGAGHAFPTPRSQGLHEPFVLSDYLDAAQGPGVYSDNMWYQLDTLKDEVISMTLSERYTSTSIFSSLIPTVVNMSPGGTTTESMTFKGVFAMEPNNEALGLRQIWLPSNYVDTYEQQVFFQHYGDKVTLHEYDDRVQAYLFRNRPGLVAIASTLLAESVTIHLDLLARNALLSTPRVYWSGSATDFGDITSTDLFDIKAARQIWMDLAYEAVPMALQGDNGAGPAEMFCVTTPSVIFDVKQQADVEWIDARKYGRPNELLNYEVGMFDGVRYIQNNRGVLWNVGSIAAGVQAVTTADYGPGAGADYTTLVDGVYKVGQSAISTGIAVDAVTNLAVNDMVTIHRTRISTDGVVNGVDYREGNARLRRIVKIDALELFFDKPIFDDLPAGSFITKAESVHPSIFIAGPEAAVNAVADPISVKNPAPVDDLGAIYRFAWSGRYDYNLFRPEQCRVVYSYGTPPTFGAGVNG